MPAEVAETKSLQLDVSADVLSDIEAQAARLGISPTSYLLTLHGIRMGRLKPSILETIREVFSHDQEILKRLA